jgi:hypothetical protein
MADVGNPNPFIKILYIITKKYEHSLNRLIYLKYTKISRANR